MTTIQCPSTFLGAQCGEPEGHDGAHCIGHSSGHVTLWPDEAADESHCDD
jgi:hypothetical protein